MYDHQLRRVPRTSVLFPHQRGDSILLGYFRLISRSRLHYCAVEVGVGRGCRFPVHVQFRSSLVSNVVVTMNKSTNTVKRFLYRDFALEQVVGQILRASYVNEVE